MSPAKGKKTDRDVKVTLVRSPIGHESSQRRTLVGLGLGKLNSSKVLKDSPELRGMVNKVSHLIKVEEL